jgi:hypothetical protein
MYMAKLVTAAAFSFVLLIGALYSLNLHVPPITGAQATSTASVYFQDRMYDIGVDRIGGMPIEGFDATTLLNAFPGLAPEDFNGVASAEGIYTYTDGALAFQRTRQNPVSSAEKTVSAAGYATLLRQVASRLGLPAQTDAQIDAILIVLAPSDVAVDENRSARITARIDRSTSALDVTITPRAVIEDSRCPEDVQCIWAGTVKIEADIESGMGKATETMQLNVPITTEAEVVTLTEVRPAKRSSGEIAKAQYEFVFTVEKRAAI